VQIRKRAVENWSNESRDSQYSLAAASRFVGALEEALSRFDQVDSEGDLALEIEDIRIRVRDLEDALRKADVNNSLRRVLRRFSTYAARVIPSLDAENPDDPINLSIAELTVTVSGDDRDNYLWEIGSGANWLAYHLATSIALHQLFIEQAVSPVPSFAVYDQPSQVYFPNRPRPHGDDIEAVEINYRDADIEAVTKIFRTLSEAVTAREGMWQAIVLDHADQSIWGEIPALNMVEEWRGDKLVPPTWLSQS
jgi:hypothetical protein